MLDYAASRQSPDSRITWRQADASWALPFVIMRLLCRSRLLPVLGAMFFPTAPSGLPVKQSESPANPEGQFFYLNVWDRIEEKCILCG